MMTGFVQLRDVRAPVFVSVHGFLQGGAMSTMFNCDYRVSDRNTMFQHGNLPRGVSPAGGYSATPFLLFRSVQARAAYLCNEIFSAGEALSQEVLDEVCAIALGPIL